MDSLKGQLTLRGILIGCLGCVIITAASAYTALKMGALPWPIIFAAIVSLFLLKVISKGSATLNEVNVTHTIMSAGAMVAGGLSFTIPALWMLGYESEVGWIELLFVALAGISVGLVCTLLIRKHFIEHEQLEFPIGEATVQTLQAGTADQKTGMKLVASMGLAGIYTALRDFFGLLPTILFSNASLAGVSFGLYNSPMMIAVGFLVGTGAVLVWFLGALFANFGIIVGGTNFGFWDLTTAQNIVTSLGMGTMMGAGVAVICRHIIPGALRTLKCRKSAQSGVSKNQSDSPQKHPRTKLSKASLGIVVCGISSCALILCFALSLSPLVCIVVVILTWVTTAMSAQSVGQSGIDPMEIFGLIVLLAVAAFSDTSIVQLFFVAAVVAVACGLAGDVMNDFHAGYKLNTNPYAQWVGQAIGSLVGAVISVIVLTILLKAYGSDAFGLEGTFVAAQASVVATMVSGIPSLTGFFIGLSMGIILYYLNVPTMLLGLGIYLPFYLSFTAFIGAMLKLAYDTFSRYKQKDLDPDLTEQYEKRRQESGLIVASGALGGESIVGVLVALCAIASGIYL